MRTKRLFAMLLAAVLMLSGISLPARAETADEKNTADALYQMGLFLGTGNSYDLDKTLTRNQGVILLVRMLGKEEEAKSLPYTAPFPDVAEAAKPHVSYAYAHNLTNGITATSFGGGKALSDKQFYALVLRALGYSDSGLDPDFKYADTRAMAAKVGLVSGAAADNSFTRGEVVDVFWEALHTPMKGSSETMGDKLLEQGVFTTKELAAAERIQVSGLAPGDKSGEKGTEIPLEEQICTHETLQSRVSMAASCTQNGVRTHICADCGESWDEIIPATGHTPVADAAVAASCTAAGKTAGSHCSVCGTVIEAQQPIPMLKHNYVNGSCTYCGEKDPNAPVVCAHTHVTETVTKEATCEADGVCTHTCTDCKATWTTAIPAVAHTIVTDAAVAASCTAPGKTAGSHCSVCGKVLTAQQTIPALGHTLATDKAIAATCTTAGKTAGSHCIVCGTVLAEQKAIPATGHTVAADAAVAATCTTAGKTAGSHCSVCGAVLTAQQAVPALNHSIVIDPAVPATATTAGKTEGSHCSRCGKVIVPQKTVPAIGGGTGGGTFELPPMIIDERPL